MSITSGQRITHPEFGEGVILSSAGDGYVRVFFPVGERLVHEDSLQIAQTKIQRIISNVEGGEDRLKKAWLHYESHALPLAENAAALTSASIDLLPHQVVLTHRIATSLPRRYLIADEVGLGKTIEAALILRELASRGELKRALMIVPAGLVNNWHRELNEVFHLNFEVFGSEGDVTDRKSNAFAKHDRLIASVDTLKRRARVKRLLEAPKWDLVVFDEAHHLSAYKNGSKVRKTENYKLAEALKNHSRDLLLLSATPHQGDHFRFWMLIQLLNPTLFNSPDEMISERHRLNEVIYRRTKADACAPDGSPLFARRWVHTESFVMSEEEQNFYSKLRIYLQDGFALAKKQGSKGNSLGFVMTIFQKIAASSFAALRSTLRRRLLMLTVHEAIIKDQAMDVDGHVLLINEAKRLIHEDTGIAEDTIGRSEVDRILADYRHKLLKKLDEEEMSLAASSESSELMGDKGEEMAILSVDLALPEERGRILELLQHFPTERETKVDKLIRGLGALWQNNKDEKVVIFATYLATVNLIATEIDKNYPGQGVVVLRGGDHASKLAAEKKFRKADGPKVIVCTAAGREGINLQFARILFNFDLPFNPMDLEQRIGRIHRYNQKHTAQVYNLVLSDTIEGNIFLLLTEKLQEIANTLGKVDEHGNVAEDLKSQILGQLSEKLSYDQLYREALDDPELKRTKEELDAAMTNASEARKVVFELFQDLDSFSLDDYKPFENIDEAQHRLMNFLKLATSLENGEIRPLKDQLFDIVHQGNSLGKMFTFDRDLSRTSDDIHLMGVDHPFVVQLTSQYGELNPEEVGTSCSFDSDKHGVLTLWKVMVTKNNSEQATMVISLAVDENGGRMPSVEKRLHEVFLSDPVSPVLSEEKRGGMVKDVLEPMLQRELQQRGVVAQNTGISSEMIGWIEVV